MIENSFGIPELREQLLGDGLELENVTDVPLCPWRIRGHHLLRVEVDDTEEAFQSFRRRLGGVRDLLEDGRLVVVNGIEGSGKTTLIHRCVDDLQSRIVQALGRTPDDTPTGEPGDWALRSHEDRVCIADLSDKASKVAYVNGQICPIAVINRRIFERVVDALIRRFGPSEKLRALAANERDSPEILYEKLSEEFLQDRKFFLLVILPSIKLGPRLAHLEFLRSYVNFTDPRLVFFGETTERDIAGELGPFDYRKKDVLVNVSVGELKDIDLDKFVKTRTSRKGLAKSHVIIAPRTLSEARPDIEYKTVRVLQNWLFEVGEIARGASREEILPDDFTVHQERLLGTLVRHRGEPRPGGDGQGESQR
ncbi:hypothetical protein Skr01_03890 [Sphaerisporangium krabiense]|uniref:Uncharacterized protein n=1 Tax=Sphaerisporangium krabiense TaxID=763782 RepID=A0A7W9DSY2_9ACTN|nr:hypothetical protein [Sphaerisporangium krabiense]MBB5628855.1 hypothetical protein [Sphaerisporangium krabiense]GII60304.1 hypothetical protein Skr01_03890 [Sphaerisporangium krabiense]